MMTKKTIGNMMQAKIIPVVKVEVEVEKIHSVAGEKDPLRSVQRKIIQIQRSPDSGLIEVAHSKLKLNSLDVLMVKFIYIKPTV